MVESRVKVFTDFIDFDPSDDDVDATPVTINDTQAFDISKTFSVQIVQQFPSLLQNQLVNPDYR